MPTAGAKTQTTRKPRSKVDPNETPEQRFRRLASKRVTRAVNTIDSLANLAGPRYSYTPEQTEAMLNHLIGALNRVKAAFEKPQRGADKVQIVL